MSKKKPSNIWKNRIISHGEKRADEFRFHDLNWKSHPKTQRDALHEILSKIGWVSSVIVNRTTENLIDGHARISEALERNPGELIPFTEVELSVEEEREILLLFDPLGALAVTENDLFIKLNEIVALESSALLEVVANLSRSNLAETADLPRTETGVGVQLQYLKFDGETIPLTDDELSGLRARLKSYVDETGTLYGFAGNLLGL